MRTPDTALSFLRHPTSTLLATPASVRVLRELLESEAPLSVATLAQRTRLSPQGVRNTLATLGEAGFVEVLGEGRSRLFRPDVGHPLYLPLGALFRAERERFETIVEGVATALEHLVPTPLGAWIYGCVAREEDRPDADLELAVVTPDDDVETPVSRLRELLEPLREVQRVWISVVGLSPGDVRRLAGGGGGARGRGGRAARGTPGGRASLRGGGDPGSRARSGQGARPDRWWTRATEEAIPLFGMDPVELAEELARPGASRRHF